jgi:hypothetical protein
MIELDLYVCSERYSNKRLYLWTVLWDMMTRTAEG